MKTKLDKKLTLNRETVSELTESQLDQAAGGGTNSFPRTCICTNTETSCSATNCC